ncbi:MAG: hypothetical protein ACYS5V_09815 [Planctomycetota bacterium]|jgi:hypothetical protein
MNRPAILLTIVLLGTLACPGLARPAGAENAPRYFHWPNLHQAGTFVPAAGETKFHSLLVENTQSAPATLTVLVIPDPKITKPRYAIHGQVRYEDVEGRGYLEMWNHFPPDGRYFTRTLGTSGPMRSLEGSSDWRPFILPFLIGRSGMRPQKLVVNVVLPGKGRVWLSPLRLVEYEQDEDPLAAPGQWWTDRQGGFIGAIFGVLFGCMGALVGTLYGYGKARRLVLGLITAMFVAGLAGLVMAVVALVQSQPYAVYYPPLLSGILLTVLPIGAIRRVRKHYEQIELRKMKAKDAVVQ